MITAIPTAVPTIAATPAQHLHNTCTNNLTDDFTSRNWECRTLFDREKGMLLSQCRFENFVTLVYEIMDMVNE